MARIYFRITLAIVLLSVLVIGAGKVLGQFRDSNTLMYIRRLQTGFPQIFLLDTSARIEQALTNRPIGNSFAIWSPDGQSIAYFNPDGLYVMDAFGRNHRLLLADAVSCLPACWSPDSRRLIVYITGQDAPGARIVDVATGEVRGLVENQNVIDQMRWSPGNAYFLRYFDTFNPPKNQLMVVNADTGENVLTTDEQGTGVNGAWSPDGRYIVYMQAEADDREIYVGDIATGMTWNVSQMPDDDDSNPVWSPDGTQLAFRSGDRVAIVDIHGNNRRFLQSTALIDQLYAWVESQLLVLNRVDATARYHDLIWMDVDTGETQPIARDVFDNRSPQLSPDGRFMVYFNHRDSLVRVVTTTGDPVRTIRFGDGGLQSGSAWSPDSRELMFSVFSGGDIVYILNMNDGDDIIIYRTFSAQWRP